MGVSGISPGSLLLILLIVVLLFGTKKLQSLGEDLGQAIKGFKRGVREIKEIQEIKESPPIENREKTEASPDFKNV